MHLNITLSFGLLVVCNVSVLWNRKVTRIKDMTTQEESYIDSSHYYLYRKCMGQQMRISILMFFLLKGTEPPDAAIEHAGIIALQAQEIQVDHSVSKLMQLYGNSYGQDTKGDM